MEQNQQILIDAKKLASTIGVGLSHLYGLAKQGRLPLKRIRLGRSVRFDIREVRAWIAASCPAQGKWTWPTPPPAPARQRLLAEATT
jgi:excisionase family DNA binding protein